MFDRETSLKQIECRPKTNNKQRQTDWRLLNNADRHEHEKTEKWRMSRKKGDETFNI